MTQLLIGRRALLGGAASLAALSLAGCATSGSSTVADETTRIPPDVLAMYAALPNEQFPLPAARIDVVPPQYWRQVVDCRAAVLTKFRFPLRLRFKPSFQRHTDVLQRVCVELV